MAANMDESVLSVESLFEHPGLHLDPVLGHQGFTMPASDGLEQYDLDCSEQRALVTGRHGLKVALASRSRGNKLLVHAALKLPKLLITCRGEDSICVIGARAGVSGSIEMHDRSRVVIAGGTEGRLQLQLVFQSPDQRFFWGRGSTAMGAHTSMRGRGAALIVGDDCMLSWRVWFRPSDMHLIVDLDSGRMMNPAANIVVEPHVWIGQETLVLKGARIGAGSIIGGKSLVPGGTYERMAAYGGNPARKIRSRVTWDRGHVLSEAALRRVRAVEAAYGRMDDTSAAVKQTRVAGPAGMLRRVRAGTDWLRRKIGRR